MTLKDTKIHGILAGIFLLVVINNVAAECEFPHRLWCSSRDIAKKCKVEKQCEGQWTVQQEAAQVNVSLYYESLCPFSIKFILDQLWPTYRNVSQIMNLTLVPYGNAKETLKGNSWEFSCQHGTAECIGNTIQSCAVYLMKNITQYLPYVTCIENKTKSMIMPTDSATYCAKLVGAEHLINKIDSCAKGHLGQELQHIMALKTMALDPPHRFVPWVTVNGVHNDQIQAEAQKDLQTLICDTYKGKKPVGCIKGTLDKSLRV